MTARYRLTSDRVPSDQVTARYTLTDGRIESQSGKVLGRVFLERPGTETPFTAIILGKGLGYGKTPEEAATDGLSRAYPYPWARSSVLPTSGVRGSGGGS